jgi:hypothetical protein
MADENQNPGRKWRGPEKEGDGNRFFESYRYTPFTTDLAFFRDPNIYETEVARTTQENNQDLDSSGEVRPHGERRTDGQIKKEIHSLLDRQGQFDAGKIRVDVENGTVTLSGNVGSNPDTQTAEGIVGNVFGVLKINNHLDISPQSMDDRGDRAS